MIELAVGIYAGGALNQVLALLAVKSWRRLSVYHCLFAAVYWLPLAIEMILERKDDPQ